MSTISVGSGESVQAAIDSASNGDRIEIAAGSFQEGIDLGGKSLTLVGAGAASTTIGGTSVAVCLTAAGGDLIVESLSFAGCDTLVAAAGGSFTFTDVELWGSDDPGTADGVDWTWIAGALSLVNGPLTVWNATVDWEGIAISDNTSVSTIVVFNDCVTELLGVEITANTLTYWPSAVLDVSGGALVVDTMDAHDNVFYDSLLGYGVMQVDGGLDVTIVDSTFADNDGSNEALLMFSDGTLTTERCTFEGNRTGLQAPTWTSTDDLFIATGVPYGVRSKTQGYFTDLRARLLPCQYMTYKAPLSTDSAEGSSPCPPSLFHPAAPEWTRLSPVSPSSSLLRRAHHLSPRVRQPGRPSWSASALIRRGVGTSRTCSLPGTSSSRTGTRCS